MSDVTREELGELWCFLGAKLRAEAKQFRLICGGLRHQDGRPDILLRAHLKDYASNLDKTGRELSNKGWRMRGHDGC